VAIKAFICLICLRILMIGYSCNKKIKFLRDFITKMIKGQNIYGEICWNSRGGGSKVGYCG